MENDALTFKTRLFNTGIRLSDELWVVIRESRELSQAGVSRWMKENREKIDEFEKFIRGCNE